MQHALALPDTYLLLSVQLQLLLKVSEGGRLVVLRWHHVWLRSAVPVGRLTIAVPTLPAQ